MRKFKEELQKLTSSEEKILDYVVEFKSLIRSEGLTKASQIVLEKARAELNPKEKHPFMPEVKPKESDEVLTGVNKKGSRKAHPAMPEITPENVKIAEEREVQEKEQKRTLLGTLRKAVMGNEVPEPKKKKTKAKTKTATKPKTKPSKSKK